MVFFQVKLPNLPDHTFWMVVSRPGAGRQPWFLITNEPIFSVQEAWRIVLGYNRRWQIDTSFRLDKSELAIESIRLLDWPARQKLMVIVALVHAFLLSLLAPALDFLRNWLLEAWCHRTGKWSLKVKAPLYRLRSAISRLWLAHPPPFLLRLSSG